MALFIPSTPDPDLTTLIASLLRHVLTILGTIGAVHGTYSDSTIQIVAGALAAIVALLWSYYQKRQAAKLDHDGSVRSAQTGAAVKAT